MVSYNYGHFLALIIREKTNLIIYFYLAKKLKLYENHKKIQKIATFLIGCLTMIPYSFRGLLYLILKRIRLWKKGYSSCFGEDYQQYTKHIIKYVDNHFNNDKNIKILIPNTLDGLHILCTVRRGFKLDCYETQDEFINGGTIDNFNIIALKEKLNYFNYNDKVNL